MSHQFTVYFPLIHRRATHQFTALIPPIHRFDPTNSPFNVLVVINKLFLKRGRDFNRNIVRCDEFGTSCLFSFQVCTLTVGNTLNIPLVFWTGNTR